jgi:signal transduction histidine kinase
MRGDAGRAAAPAARRLELLEAVVAASNELLAAERLADAAREVVERLGVALRADRVFLSRMLPADARSATGYIEFFAEWTAAGISRQTDDPAFAVLDCAPYVDIMGEAGQGRALQVLTDELSDSFARSEQLSLGTLSQFVYPIIVDGAHWGNISADDCRARRIWDEAEIRTLRLVASAVGSVVRRDRLTEARVAAERAAAAERERAEAARLQGLLEERTRLSREIHDSLAQGFTAIIRQGEVARARRARGDEAAAWEHLARSTELARFGLSEARRAVRALRPLVLERQGLVPALHDLAGRVAIPGFLDCVVDAPRETRRLDPELEEMLFRVVQEGIANALRHAAARSVRVRLRVTDRAAELLVEDDGIGFEPSGAHHGQAGSGLDNLRQRVASLGGRLALDGRPGRGARLRVRVPLPG